MFLQFKLKCNLCKGAIHLYIMDLGWIQLKNKAFIDLQVFITAKLRSVCMYYIYCGISGDDKKQSVEILYPLR